MKKTTWERTSVQYLLRHRKSGRYYARWTIGGKQIWRKLDTDSFTVAKLRLPDEVAKIEQQRVSTAGTTSGTGSMESYMLKLEADVKADTTLKPSTITARLIGLKKIQKTWPELAA